jgi:hypothetical protein
MPVRKFRSVEQMIPPPAQQSPAGSTLRAALALSHTCLAFDRRRPPAGVYKHRSADEAWEARRRWEREGSGRGDLAGG